MIREVQSADIPRICRIYNHYVLNTVVTFEERSVSVAEMTKRVEAVKAGFPYYVFTEGDTVHGYAYAKYWRTRDAYRYALESTIYLDNQCLGQGIGTRLYTALLEELKTRKYHVIMAGLGLPNEPSRCLHEKLGFKKVAHLPEMGYKFGRWVDVGYWQLILGPTAAGRAD